MENVVVKESQISGKGVFSARSFKKDEEILDIDDSHVVTDTTKLTREQHELELDYLADGKISARSCRLLRGISIIHVTPIVT